jgi:uncharacterized membrane protein YphA (DoxX/SURF4 family)
VSLRLSLGRIQVNGAIGIHFACVTITLISDDFEGYHLDLGRYGLLRLFSLTYPYGRAGIGLLLLRAAVGLTAVAQGGVYLSSRDNPMIWTWVVGLLAIATGFSLLIGILTPVACILVGSGSTTIAFSSFPVNTQYLINDGLSLPFVVIVATSIVLLGPGAYSIDARLFGRREIIIPD